MTTPETWPSRRRFLALAGATILPLRPAGVLANGEAPLRIGLPQALVAPSLDALSCMERYFRETSKRPVVLVLRRSVQELASLVLADEVDGAWITGFALVQRR